MRSDAWVAMDYRGALLFGMTIMLTMGGVINLPNIWAIPLIAAGTVMLFIIITTMKKTKSPVLDISVFKHKVFSRACIAAFMNYAASHSVAIFMVLYLESIGRLGPLQAGLIIVIQPIFQVALTAKFGSYSDRIKDKRILPTAGMATICVGVLMILFLGEECNLIYVGVLLAILGFGYAMFAAPNTNAVMSALPPRNRGEASGMIALVRQIGMITSMSIAMCCVSLIMGTIDNLNDESTWPQFIVVIKIAFTICLSMCIIGTFFSWFRGDTKKKGSSAQ
jgi:MFS family permease